MSVLIAVKRTTRIIRWPLVSGMSSSAPAAGVEATSMSPRTVTHSAPGLAAAPRARAAHVLRGWRSTRASSMPAANQARYEGSQVVGDAA